MTGIKPGGRPTIQCAENGPYIVRGVERLTSETGEPLPTGPVIALCRCGGSRTKPFCDGTHSRNGFVSA